MQYMYSCYSVVRCHILRILSSIYVTSHAKTYTNGFPFANGKPFTTRVLPVLKNIAPVRTAWVTRAVEPLTRSTGLITRSIDAPTRSHGLITRSAEAPTRSNSLTTRAVEHSFARLGRPFGKNCIASIRTA